MRQTTFFLIHTWAFIFPGNYICPRNSANIFDAVYLLQIIQLFNKTHPYSIQPIWVTTPSQPEY